MDEMTALRTMAERLAARVPGVSPPSAGAPPRVVPAAVPDEWPASIPLPPDAVVIGTVHYPGSPPSTEMMLDVPQDAHHARSFFLKALSETGWTSLEQAPSHGGFLFHGPLLSFSQDTTDVKGGMYLIIDVQPDGGAAPRQDAPPTDGVEVRLTLTVFTRDSRVPPPRDAVPAGLHVLPVVRLPPDAVYVPNGNMSGYERAETSAVLRTDMDQASLAAFLAGQLGQAGWTARDAGLDGALSWSAWTFKDSQSALHLGTLYVLRCPDQPRQYRLVLMTKRAVT